MAKRWGWMRAGRWVATLVTMVVVWPSPASGAPGGAAAAPAPVPVSITTGGENGVGRSNQPGLPCARGGDGASWHYGYESSLAAGTFSALPTELRMNLDVHAEGAEGPHVFNGFLQGSESTVALVNERGTTVLRLEDGGGCDNRTADVSTTHATTFGTWDVVRGSGAYETISGTGEFTVTAGIAPGADNDWSLQLTGDVDVEQPTLEAQVMRVTWGPLGLDLLTRRPWVQVRLTNTGPDAFAARLTGASSPTQGVTLISGAPADLGDLLPGESVVVTLRYQLALLGPCDLIVTLCDFDVRLATAMTDALDRAVTDLDTVHVSDNLLGIL